MAFTEHGHQVPGTPVEDLESRPSVHRCGGVNHCSKCISEVEAYAEKKAFTIGTSDHYPAKAMKLVRDFIGKRYEWGADGKVEFDLYVPWFSKTLHHWKATVATTLEDGMYYEVTHNGLKNVTYIDAYKKVANEEIRDEEV